MKTPLLRACVAASALLMAASAQQQDPPDRVARLNLATGAVSMLTPSTGPDWTPAQINYPLTSGDQLWTDFDGRAELHIGPNSIRLREQTSATFTILDDQTVQLQLVSGGLNLHVRNLYNGEILEVDTPNLAFTVRQTGDYRIEVNGQQTRVTVWSGNAEISGADNRTVPLRAGDFAVVSGYGQLSYTVQPVPAADEFDRWARDRDNREQQLQAQSAAYVPPGTIGAEDLGLYGTWSEVPDLGPVWAPRVDPTWVPYKTGHWAWIEPWGWTWIDDAPWGFAPFHYGRWAQVSGAWVWAPGPRTAQRAVYSPALVVWAGAESRTAWFPLGPGEVYNPGYRASGAYLGRINRGAASTNYVNRRAPGAVVAMSRTDMASGRRNAAGPVSGGSVQVIPAPPSRPDVPPRQAHREADARIPRPPVAIATPSHPVIRRHDVPNAPARARNPEPARSIPGRESETVRPVRPAYPAPAATQGPRPVVAERPAAVVVPPQSRPAEPPQRPERIERPSQIPQPPAAAPASAPPVPVRVERPATVPQAPRPEVRAGDQRGPERKRDEKRVDKDKRPERREEKKDEKKQQ